MGTVTGSPTNCNFLNDNATCGQTIRFTTPNVTDTIQVKIDPVVPEKSPANRQLQPRSLRINFSVKQQVAKLDTTTTFPDPQCALYRGGTIGLKASLAEALSGNPIVGRSLGFSLKEAPIGSSITQSNGEATLPYSIDHLAAGDYPLYAEFAGDSSYNGSNVGGTLGLRYLFVGFQQPINSGGNSVFGNGRVIPIKIRVAGANGEPVTNAQPTVWISTIRRRLAWVRCLRRRRQSPPGYGQYKMRYVASDNHYICNWDLSSLVNGTYAVEGDVGDSKACGKGPYYAVITVNKKGGK